MRLNRASRRKPGSTDPRPRPLKGGSRLSPGRLRAGETPAFLFFSVPLWCIPFGESVSEAVGGAAARQWLGLARMRRPAAQEQALESGGGAPPPLPPAPPPDPPPARPAQ